MEEKRKSVLETVTPTNALATYGERRRQGRAVWITVLAVVVLGLIFIVAGIIHNATKGTQDLRVPSVVR